MAATEGNTHRVGFDPLGAETSGDIVAISVEPVGTHLDRGNAFGSLEAAKFVGPLISPVSGIIRAHNTTVSANPSLVNSHPLEAWIMEIEPDNLAAEEGFLLNDPAQLTAWLEHEIDAFKKQGMVAE
jgi:glycine cleavage system H protein